MPTIKIKGVAAAAKVLRGLGSAIPDAVAAARYREANRIMATTIPITPIAARYGGTLRGSAYVAAPGKDRKVEFGFGVDYAVPVHERTEDTNWSDPTTGPKFLERGIADRAEDRLRRIAADARQLKKSGRVFGGEGGSFPTYPRHTGDGS